jgi:hypothetical protein
VLLSNSLIEMVEAKLRKIDEMLAIYKLRDNIW